MTFQWPSWVDPLPFPFPELHNLMTLYFIPDDESWWQKIVAEMSFEDTTDRNVLWYQIVDQIADEVNLTDLEVLPSDPRNASMIKVSTTKIW